VDELRGRAERRISLSLGGADAGTHTYAYARAHGTAVLFADASPDANTDLHSIERTYIDSDAPAIANAIFGSDGRAFAISDRSAIARADAGADHNAIFAANGDSDQATDVPSDRYPHWHPHGRALDGSHTCALRDSLAHSYRPTFG
jgi:hypothetical protein